MISAIGSAHRTIPPGKPAKPDITDLEGERGNSAQSIGHRAKQAVAESGDTAPNAIGKAASMLAKLKTENLSITPLPEVQI